MAVIITNMDMPQNCSECVFLQEDNRYGKSCRFTNVPALNIGRQIDCPLKSTDGLAEEIKQFPFTYGYGFYIGRAIDQYCKEEK